MILSLVIVLIWSSKSGGEEWTTRPKGYTLEEDSIVGSLATGRATLEMIKTYKAERDLLKVEYEVLHTEYVADISAERERLKAVEEQINADLKFQRHKALWNGIGTGFIGTLVIGGIAALCTQ
jgi:hypothetical protein